MQSSIRVFYFLIERKCISKHRKRKKIATKTSIKSES